MANLRCQSTDHMNLGSDKGGNTTGGASSANDRKSQAFRTGRDADNNDYQRNIPHGTPKRRS